MLENILDDEDDAFVFFYEDNDTDAHTILEELEQVDEKLDKQDLAMVKISDEGAIDNYGIEVLSILHENQIPIYWGYKYNLKKSLAFANDKKAEFVIIIGEEEYKKGLKEGKKHLEYLDKIRGTDITKIFKANERVLEWWTNI